MKTLNSYIIEALSNELFEFLNSLNNSKVIFATDSLKEKYNLKELTISKTLNDNDDYITLDKIIMNDKGNGYGSIFMRDLCRWSDMYGKIICLTPDKSFGASSVSRLQKFYKKFGFIENKGSKTDFNIREKMYRKV